MAKLPGLIRRGEIYKANLGADEDILVTVVSSNEANALLRDVGVCEVLGNAPLEYERIPIACVFKETETTLQRKLIAVGKVANVPKAVLVEKEGVVGAFAMEKLDQAIKVWLGFETWT